MDRNSHHFSSIARALALNELRKWLWTGFGGNRISLHHRLSFVTVQESKEVVMSLRSASKLLSSWGLLAVLSLIATVLAAQDVRYNSMPGTDFSKYHTYKWVAIEGASHPNQIMDAEIKQSVDSQLAAKGLTKTDSDKADVYVGYQIAVDRRNSGTGTEWGVEFAGEEWRLQQARPSVLELSSLTCTIRQQSSSFGLEVRRNLLIPVPTNKRTRRT